MKVRRTQLEIKSDVKSRSKVCTKCNTRKDFSEFSKRTKSKDGYEFRCKKCLKPAPISFNIAGSRTKDEVQNDIKLGSKVCNTCNTRKDFKYFTFASGGDGKISKCKECTKYYSIYTKYGLTKEAYLSVLNSQGGACKLCGTKERLYVDHCHTTGKVRGILCGMCNSGLGDFRDDTDLLEKAIIYLKTT